MLVKPYFEKNEIISIEEYLKRLGVDDLELFMNPDSRCLNKWNGVLLSKCLSELQSYVLDTNYQYYIVLDCDVDGVCSASIAYLALRELFNVDKNKIEVLVHDKKVHGLTKDIMDKIKPHSFVWIPDAGSNDAEQCKILKDNDCIVLITDHHEITTENPYALIINNTTYNCTRHNGSGTSVTWDFVEYIKNISGIHDACNCIDLVSIANPADSVDMRAVENRYISHYALNVNQNKFIKRLKEDFVKSQFVTNTDISWSIAPKINAVIRLGDKDLLLNIFYCIVGEMDNYDEVIKKCASAHRKQQNISKKMAETAIESVEDDSKNLIIAFSEESAFTGLIANKLMSHYNKPVFVVHEDDGYLSGSCRSPYDNTLSVENNSGFFEYAQGHEQAHGIKFDKNNIDNIYDLFQNGNNFPESVHSVLVDCDYNNIPNSVFPMNEKYKEYWGEGVPEPTISVRNIPMNLNDFMVLGKTKTTIKFNIGNVDYVKFFVSRDVQDNMGIGENKKVLIDIIGTPNINEYNGYKTNQVVIDKIEIKPYEENKISFDDLF